MKKIMIKIEKMQKLGNIDRTKMMLTSSINWHGQWIDRWRGKYSLSDIVVFKVGNYGFTTKDEAKAFIDN